MKFVASILVVICALSCKQQNTDLVKQQDQITEQTLKTDANVSGQIIESIEAWNKAWEIKDAQLAVKYYANETDWTNEFGDSAHNKEKLKELIQQIFNIGFPKGGTNEYGMIEMVFLNDSIATVKSKSLRVNQKWKDGTIVPDQHFNHLRVYKNINGEWLIINHMISQVWPKNRPSDTLSMEN